MSDYVPMELQIEILVKLPVKSLIRYTTVCKSWHSLITSPSFVRLHISENKNHAVLVRGFDGRREHYSLLKVADDGVFNVISSSQLEFPFQSQLGYFRIVGSCNGLVCLSDDVLAPLRTVIIWNPSVRNHVVLPKATTYPEGLHIFAFGFGVAGDDYKVVRLFYCKKSEGFGHKIPPHVEVFSLKTGKWRRVEGVDVKLQLIQMMWSQAFLKGVVHWPAYERINDIRTTSGIRCSILGFHLDKEVFTEVLLPNELAGAPAPSLFASLIEESIAMVKYDTQTGSKPCEVWMMKEYGVKESWTKLYTIDLSKGLEKVVAFWKSGEVLMAYDYEGSELVVYHPETKQTRNLGICGIPLSLYVDNYVESLLLLKENSD